MLAALRAGMGGLSQPGPRQAVGNRCCAYSFDSPYSAGGLFVNLKTFAGCGADFVQGDAARSGCALYAHHAWRKVPKAAAPDAAATVDAPPTTLGVGVEGGFEAEDAKYDVEKVRSVAAVVDGAPKLIALPNPAVPDFAVALVDAALDQEASDAATDRAWALADEEVKESKYARDLPQLSPEAGGRAAPLDPDPATWRCEASGDAENLWLNLSTGFIGGGRDQAAWGGPKGSNGALQHFEATGKKYPLVVKLGTISAAGAELYSYAPDEDGPVSDPKLNEHLRFWGINALASEKTEKTTAELEVDANAKFEWSAIAEAGAKLVPLAGAGLQGLVNLGNSCYMNSVAHLLASVPEIGRRYHGLLDDATAVGGAARSLVESAPTLADCHLAQTARLVSALRSKRYAKPADALIDPALAVADRPTLPAEIATQDAAATVAPRRFRTLFGRGHAEFSTPRQQDAAEYLLHVLDALARAERVALEPGGRLATAADAADAEAPRGPVEYGPYDVMRTKPTEKLFAFQLEEKILCGQSGAARYKPATQLMLELGIPSDLVPTPDDAAESEAKRLKLDDGSETPKPRVGLEQCLAAWAAEETIDFTSSATGLKGVAAKTQRLKTCPRYLLLKINRYYISKTWEPKKLDVLVDVPTTLDLSSLKAGPRPAGEQLLPDDAPAPAAAAAAFKPDEGILAQLLGMGFDENGCKRACRATQNAGAEAAMEWVFGHMGDPDFATPYVDEPAGGAAAPSEGPDPDKVAGLAALGFTARQAEGALKACGGDAERAADWIFSRLDDLDGAVDAVLNEAPAGGSAGGDASTDFDDGDPTYELKGLVSHIGSNTGCGHYVAHLRDKEGNFVIFDDEKVARSEKPPLQLGYVYLYARK